MMELDSAFYMYKEEKNPHKAEKSTYKMHLISGAD